MSSVIERIERLKVLATDLEDGMDILDEDESADDIRKLIAAYEAVKAVRKHTDELLPLLKDCPYKTELQNLQESADRAVRELEGT